MNFDEIKFLTNEPALLLERTLVVADLHLGIEHEFYKSGIKIPSQTAKIKARIDKLLDQTKAKKLIILGDVKHKVPGVSWQELREIPEFLEYFANKLKVEIVPGNHDASLKDFVPLGVKIHPSSGFKLDNYFLNHGHTWPNKYFLTTTHIIIGHNHPQLEFRDKLGYHFTEAIWVRVSLDKSKIVKKYGQVKKLPELVVMPTFNEFAGGISFNREKGLLGPIIKCANLQKSKIYLLDGTFLGLLKNLISS